MQTHTITDDDRELDRLCWITVSNRNRFHPPDETADECAENLSENEPDDETIACEEGYHSGMFLAYDNVVQQLYSLGVDVLGRANRYVQVHDEHGVNRLGVKPRGFCLPAV